MLIPKFQFILTQFYSIHITFLLFIFTLIPLTSSIIFNLSNNKNWQFTLDNIKYYPASLPSTLIDDLITNNILDKDFYYRDNFLKAYKFETKDVFYSLIFNLSSSQLEYKDCLGKKYQEIVFEGLDTHANIWLNDQHILQAHNMYRTYVVPLYLQTIKKNNLTIKFTSSVTHDLNEQKIFKQKYGFQLPANYSFSRKAAYHYGWDWGPRIVSSGIWKDIKLNCYNDIKFNVLNVRQLNQIDYGNKDWKNKKIQAHIQVDIKDLNLINNYTLEIQVFSQNSNNNKTVFYQKILISRVQEYKNIFKWNITQNLTEYVWWIWQLGQQNLFTLTAKIINNYTKNQEIKIIKNIGFRTVKINQKVDQQGNKEFIINLNGYNIYVRGGNYIPPEMSLSKTTHKTYQDIIKAAKQSNFNMLRVWGGGHFQKDQFYQICDQEGILIWHDLMYACALYPYNQTIANDIEQELRDNLLRIRHHPSLGLLNGNNQVWIGWQEWGWKQNKTQQQKLLIENMYKGIFQISLPKVINQVSPHIPYWQTSPSVSSNSLNTIKSGDIHFWRVWAAAKPIQEYKQFIGRFNSEYGMQSMPDISTVQSFTLDQDRYINSLILKLHQRHVKGNQYLPEYVKNNTHFIMINNLTNNSSLKLQRFIYFSQIMQSYALQLAITSLRCSKPYNMGSLYWQLNDVWPVTSWSTIDYYGVKKAAHYKIRQIYEPLMILIFNKNVKNLSSYEVMIINDYNKTFGCIVEIIGLKFDGDILFKLTIYKEVEMMSVMKVSDTINQMSQEQMKTSFIHSKITCTQKKPVFTEINSHKLQINDQIQRSYDYFYVNMKSRSILSPQLSYTYFEQNSTLKISTKNLATYVRIFGLYKNGTHKAFKQIEDNYFNLMPGEVRYLKVGNMNNIINIKQEKAQIKVTCYQIEGLEEIKGYNIQKDQQIIQEII